MNQQHSFRDFDAFEPERIRAGWARRIVAATTVLIAVLVAGMAGYGLGRGAWTIPASVPAMIPAPLARWLPFTGVAARPAGPVSELRTYAFELVDKQVKQGEAVLAVRLVRKSTREPVPDAVIFAERLDMAPEGMPTMTTKLEAQPATEPGVYRFKANLIMEGGWQLSLAAKVQGETGTVQNKLVLKATP